MFTGLVQDIGIIRSVEGLDGKDTRMEIGTHLNMDKVQAGASICCSGCCLTVVERSKNSFITEVSAETLNKTHIGSWSAGTRINIEPSLKLGDEMGGHIVSGHVDCVTTIEGIVSEDGSHRIDFLIPSGYGGFIAQKGSATIDGISLTVNDVTDRLFSVNIIPHTWEHTTLSDRKAGDRVNIEIDMLARYVARMMEVRK